MSDRPGNNAYPVAISAKIQPMDHTSTGPQYLLAPRRSSGALYHNVTTSAVYGPDGRPDNLANPKSASFNVFPSDEMSS